jgi:hypothetical protein
VKVRVICSRSMTAKLMASVMEKSLSSYR